MTEWIKKWKVLKIAANKDYIVSQADDGSYGCSCPVWTFKRQICKHIEMVKFESPPPGYGVIHIDGHWSDWSDRPNPKEHGFTVDEEGSIAKPKTTGLSFKELITMPVSYRGVR